MRPSWSREGPRRRQAEGESEPLPESGQARAGSGGPGAGPACGQDRPAATLGGAGGPPRATGPGRRVAARHRAPPPLAPQAPKRAPRGRQRARSAPRGTPPGTLMFWDSSAVVPSLLPAARSAMAAALLRSGSHLALWWASPVECQSALRRRHREGILSPANLDQALLRLRGVVEAADVVGPTDRLRERAGRVPAAHPLRAGDALQLAAAPARGTAE